MQTLKIQIFIENMPKYDQKYGVEAFSNNFVKSLRDSNIFGDIVKYTSGLNLWSYQMNIADYSIEKKFSCSAENIEQIKKKYPLARYEDNNGGFLVIVPEKSLEERIKDCFNKVIRCHQWSSSMHFGSYNCVRPIRKISIKLNKKFISGQLSDIIFSSFESSEKSFEEKKELIYGKLEQYFIHRELINESIVEENSSCVYEPETLIVGFQKKYLDMPFDLIEKIAEEFLGFAVRNSNKCIIVVEKNIKVLDTEFERVLNEKMEDVYNVFERDMKNKNLAALSKEIYLGNNLGRTVEKTERMKNIANDIGVKNISPLIDLYYYDLSSQIVQSYPSLRGIITQKIFENGRIIRDAHKLEGTFESQALKALEYIDNVMLLPMFTSTKDPFALKKQIDFLIDFFSQHSLSFNFCEKNDVFIKRAKNRLKDHRRFIRCYTLKDQLDVLRVNPFFLSPQKIVRILNIVKNVERSTHIDVKESFVGVTILNIPESVDAVINFIDNYHINPYIERIEAIEKFISQIELLIDIRSLTENEL